MTNLKEAKRWLKDAEDGLKIARRNLSERLFRATIQFAQIAIEGSSKAVIACFAPPIWSHDPSIQLEELIERHQETLGRAIGEEIIEDLKALADSAHRAAPWHGKSVYGEERSPDEHIPAVDLCTEEIARELLEKAEDSLQITKRFIETWFHST